MSGSGRSGWMWDVEFLPVAVAVFVVVDSLERHYYHTLEAGIAAFKVFYRITVARAISLFSNNGGGGARRQAKSP